MNKSIAELYKHPSKESNGDNHMFRVFFKPDSPPENWELGMRFCVVSVNRQTGEIKFSMDLAHEDLPE